ncbi:hypothetical protein JIG36_09825 [Actinoplanes sp. LDG1-06]|uniref:Uncharacterized protein n=1 Tax=Paractinoplanes ovalisporus TaxID=2810368 RepID=A0ABS2A7P5_9ACTN|nr:hypothetical protein [Actinoplanes ovalisporus]MBM2615853.1 hypothetical protein [Actinoplanes ovalisporus]
MTAEPRTSQAWLSPSTPAAARQVHQAPLQSGDKGLAARYQAAERPVQRPFGAAPVSAYPPGRPPQPSQVFAAVGALPPTVWPVVVLTVIFGPLAVISAANRANKAAKMGLPGTSYWMAFGITTAASFALGCALYAVGGMLVGLASL